MTTAFSFGQQMPLVLIPKAQHVSQNPEPLFVVLGNGRLEEAQDIIDNDQETFQPGFRSWLTDNWHVWTRFCQEAEMVWSTGREHYSARTIIEVMRHESVTRQNGGWKLNNTWVPDLGRLYGRVHPTRASFFECRELTVATRRKPVRRSRGSVDEDSAVLEVGFPLPRPVARIAGEEVRR